MVAILCHCLECLTVMYLLPQPFTFPLTSFLMAKFSSRGALQTMNCPSMVSAPRTLTIGVLNLERLTLAMERPVCGAQGLMCSISRRML